MFDQLVAFEANEPPVADVSSQFPMLDRGAQALIKVAYEDFASGFTQPADISFAGEMFVAQLISVEQGENQAIRQQRFKDFSKVQRQAKALCTGFMQK